MKIKVYSTPTCPYCQMAKQYFKDKEIKYEDINVAEDEAKGKEMVEKSGQMGVPVIIMDNNGKEEVIVGFDQVKIEKIINNKK